MNGFLLINKSAGKTSYDIIRELKKIIPKNTKIGHSGTLDPFATGLLIIAIGRPFTKQLQTLTNLDKIYTAEVTLGKETDSYDIDGKEVYTHPHPISISEDKITNTINSFKGTFEQMPPIFSAKKINGKSAYKLAREGIEVELKPSTITIYELQLNEINQEKNTINLSVHCSKGTYIRSLAYDIGKKLNVGGFLSKLNRTSIGNVSIENAHPISEINQTTIEEKLLSSLS